MSAEKQRLYNEIETLPEELTVQVIAFIENLKLSHIEECAPNSIIIKSRKDLKEKLQEGINDIKEGRVYTLEEFFARTENI